MKSLIKRQLPYILLSALLITSLSTILLPGCTSPEGEGFAIYLTADDIDPTRMPALSHVEIADQPLISLNDIIAYNPITHEITLTSEAYENIFILEVPVSGRSFVVCVDRNPIYRGAFWTPISSYFFEGIVVMIPFGFEDNTIIKLTRHYIKSDPDVEDPRSNPEIIKSLERAGKLSTKPIATWAGEKIRHNMKGWELYSWQEGNDWHFTLIYGTNRNKNLEEIISINNTEEHNHVVGAEAIKSVLGKLPENESVTWFGSFSPVTITQAGQNPLNNIIFKLPPSNIVNEIIEYTIQQGLDFYVNK